MATRLDQSEFVKTALRLPPALHAAVHDAAEESGRSYNAQLIALIEAGLNPKDDDAAIRAMAVTLAAAEHEVAGLTLVAYTRLLDLVLVCYSMDELLDALKELGIEDAISEQEVADFKEIAEQAYEEMSDAGEVDARTLLDGILAAEKRMMSAQKALRPTPAKTLKQERVIKVMKQRAANQVKPRKNARVSLKN